MATTDLTDPDSTLKARTEPGRRSQTSLMSGSRRTLGVKKPSNELPLKDVTTTISG